MKEKSQIMAEAKGIIAGYRSDAINEGRDRHDEILDKLPEYAALTQEIASCGAKMGRLAISGKIGSAEYVAAGEKIAELSEKQSKLLEKEGYPRDYARPRFRCEKCGDTGIIKDAEGNEAACGCLKNEFGKLLLKYSNLPVKEGFSSHDPKLFGEEDEKKARARMETARKAACCFPEKSKWLILGKSGVGKTFFASMLGAELAKSGVQVMYVTLPELLKSLLYFGEDPNLSEARDSLYKLVKSVDLLILDELGTEKMSAAKQDLLADIIDTRFQDKTKGLVVVTNSTLREILNNYGERIFSRLTSKEVIIDNIELADGKDLRKK